LARWQIKGARHEIIQKLRKITCSTTNAADFAHQNNLQVMSTFYTDHEQSWFCDSYISYIFLLCSTLKCCLLIF